MIDEKEFDYENYIQEQLRRIDDLDERRFAKELLVESLGRMFAWTEEKYVALERRVRNELDLPWKCFHICMTVIDKKDYDPINNFWFPVCEEDIKKNPEQTYKTIYLEADESVRKKFMEMDILTGVDKTTGQSIRFKIKRSDRYQRSMNKLYALYMGNHVPWQTVHMGHIERFFDLIPIDADLPAEVDWTLQDKEWEPYIKKEMMLLWNIHKSYVHSREYRVPCIDEVFYEHVFYLPREQKTVDGYLVDAMEDIFSIRYEKNKIVLKTKAETLEDISVYRLCQKEPEQSAGYRYPILSNHREDNLSVRYLQQTGNFIQTPCDLYRKVEEMADGYEINILGYEIVDNAKREFLNGDMNSFTGVRMFVNDTRKVLLFRIQKEEQYREDYLYESQIRYILSQLQLEFLEYRCMGVLV